MAIPVPNGRIGLQNQRRVEVIVGGDVCPVFRGTDLMQSQDAKVVFSDLVEELRAADMSVVNLECPLVEMPSPANRPGPVLGAPVACGSALKGSGISVANLANNHILDHREQGLVSTLKACSRANIKVFGAGCDLAAAEKILVQNFGGLRIGLLGVCQHEYSIAGACSAGANPMDLGAIWRNLRNNSELWDFLIVFVHAGTEGYPYPSPRVMEFCRTVVEMGAGFVVCQHSHCPGCYEVYRDALIVYGQGNLLFDWVPNPGGAWCEGFLVKVEIEGSSIRGFRFIPHVQSTIRAGVRRMTEEESRVLLEKIEERSARIRCPDQVEKLWREYCDGVAESYYGLVLGRKLRHRILEKACRITGIRWQPFRNDHRKLLANLVRCEGHREVLETVLQEERD